MQIAILCSVPMQVSFARVVENAGLQKRFTYWVYNEFEEIGSLYEAHRHEVAGILCSGDVPYNYLLGSYPDNRLPTAHVENSTILRASLRLMRHMAEHPDIPTNRLFCDFLGDAGIYSVYAQELPPEMLPYTLAAPAISKDFFSTLAEQVIGLYREGKIQKAFLTLTTLHQKLSAAGVPCELIEILPEYIQRALYKIIGMVDGQAAGQANVLAAVLDYAAGIDSADAAELEYREVSLLKALVDYKHQKGLGADMTITRGASSIEVLMPVPLKGEVLQPMTDCLAALREGFTQPLAVGVGVAAEARSGREGAATALEYARKFSGSCAFSLHQNQLTGPLLSNKCFSFDTTYLAATTGVAKRLGINNLNYARLLALFQRQPVVTAEAVADYLNIAYRSAHRILLLLIEDGMVCEVQPEGGQKPRKGRPTKYYALVNSVQVRRAQPPQQQ